MDNTQDAYLLYSWMAIFFIGAVLFSITVAIFMPIYMDSKMQGLAISTNYHFNGPKVKSVLPGL